MRLNPALCMAAVLFAFCGDGQCSDEAIRQQIRDAWKARSERYSKAVIEWEEETLHPSGSFNKIATALSQMSPDSASSKVLPEKDVKFTNHFKLNLNGEQYKLVCDQHIWHLGKNEFEHWQLHYANDAEIESHYRNVKGSAEISGSLKLSKNSASFLASSLPIRLYLRGTYSKMNGTNDPDEFDEIHRVNENTIALYILRNNRTESQGEVTLTISDGPGFIPLRREFKERSGKSTTVFRMINTAKDANGENRPNSWEHIIYTDGKLESQRKCKITRWTVGTDEDTSYRLEFPVGTKLQDYRDMNKPIRSLVLEDNKERILSPQEFRLPSEQLIATDHSWQQASYKYYLICALAGLLILCVVVLRLRSRWRDVHR